MSCILTQWFDLDCADGLGGISEFYVIENSSLGTVTETSGVVTDITTVAAKKFQRYKLRSEVGSMQSPVNVNVQNGTRYFEHTLVFATDQLTTPKRNELNILSKVNVSVIVKDVNGPRYWLIGKTQGMYPSAGDFGTGTAAGDRNGVSLTLTGKEKEPPVEVDSTLIVAGLINGL